MVVPLTPDGGRVTAIREALPAVSAGIYLNTAAAGPLPAETARVMAEEASREASLGRGHPADIEESLERVAEARASVAAVLAADLANVGLTRGIAHGLGLACDAIPWRAGDRAILVAGEADPGPWPVEGLRNRGLDVELIPAGSGPDHVLEAIELAVRHGARLVGISHVDEATGQLLPVSRAARIAHDGGAICVLDASASVGAIEVALAELDVDVVAFPSERWLLGPVGLGGLWCRDQLLEALDRLHPDGFVDPRRTPAEGSAPGPTLPLRLPPWHRPSVAGFARSCGLLSMQIGLTWAWQRAAQLTERAGRALRALSGVEVLTPVDPAETATIVAFRIRGWGAAAAIDELGARVFAIAGLVASLDAVRISVGAWNTEDEIDRFVEGVRLLATHGPDALPPRRTLNVLE